MTSNSVPEPKLLVIVGPTASGKSALGLKLAQKFSGEIICADSKTVYRYMDIGTAKSTKAEMMLIPHHLVNIRNPDEAFSAGQFKRLALAAIESINRNSHFPMMVGGTGLYIDSLLYDYQFPRSTSNVQRPTLLQMTLDQLVERLRAVDPDALESIDLKNPRRVLRAIELAGQPRSKSLSLRPQTLVLGLSLSKESIHKRINERIEKMLSEGLIGEVQRVGEQFGWDSEAMTGPAYRAFKGVILEGLDVEEAAQEFGRRDASLAKRQMTWFKRNEDIHWLDAEDAEALYVEAEKLVSEFSREYN